MLSRLARLRVPSSRRFLSSQSLQHTSTSTRYALAAVGTLATVAFFGIGRTEADNGSNKFSAAPPPNAENFESYLTRRMEEEPRPIRSLRSDSDQGKSRESAQHVPSPSEPGSAPVAVQKTAEEAEESTHGDSGEAAFNPETGEINWDCPCLGGMAHGPCGPEFREAFSCFVHSEDEPKGINCVEKFQGMQSCFREHPEVYASEIADDEAAEAAAEKELSENSPSESPKNEVPSPEASETGAASSATDSAPERSTPTPSEEEP
ncbi:CHCH domain protein [Favolaschia claudopus]|uniref:Mitochondrial intermembrane space import and assembly protein 40 n=1 Tax=Favolaschia claudopus TaxID=2862362 RepID=A0AAW0DY82_9AGAR